MSTKITFYIARHGKTIMNTLDKVQGWCDSPLTKEGIDVARYLGYGLSDINFRSAYCSDLRRTLQTTRIVLGAMGQDEIPITELSGLREACFGSFEADFNYVMWGNAAKHLGYEHADHMYRDILDKKISYHPVMDAIKTLDTMDIAENFSDVELRTQESLRQIAYNESQQGSGNVFIVAHGMSILAMLSSLGGDKILKGHLDNAAVCKVIYQNEDFSVESMGDMSYVAKGRSFHI